MESVDARLLHDVLLAPVVSVKTKTAITIEVAIDPCLYPSAASLFPIRQIVLQCCTAWSLIELQILLRRAVGSSARGPARVRLLSATKGATPTTSPRREAMYHALKERSASRQVRNKHSDVHFSRCPGEDDAQVLQKSRLVVHTDQELEANDGSNRCAMVVSAFSRIPQESAKLTRFQAQACR